MKILDAEFKQIVDALFDTQEGKFESIFEKQKIQRFKELCKNKKLIVLGTGYYLKVLPKFLKLTYDVDIYGVYDWVTEKEDKKGPFAHCKDYDYLDLQKYNKYKENLKFISKDEFYADPENTVVFMNSEVFTHLPHILYRAGFNYYYSMRSLGKHLISDNAMRKKSLDDFKEYDINELNHVFTAPEISRIVTLYNLLEDEKSKKVYKGVLKFKLTEDYHYLLEIKDELKDQYFDKVVKFNEDEVFIDCGGYTGDTIEAFIKAVNGKFKRIYSFEPDNTNFQILKKYAEKLDQKEKIEPINAGVHYKSKSFYARNNDASTTLRDDVSGSDVEEVKVMAIEDAIKDAPTFIKMDVQTFETYALLGVMDDIIKHKPKLAICIYHKFSDLWDLPLLLKLWVPEYELFMRHYECTQEETVIYALPKSLK